MLATLRRVATTMAPELNQKAEFMRKTTHTAIEDAVDQSVQANIILNVLPAWRQSQLEERMLKADIAYLHTERDNRSQRFEELQKKYDRLRKQKKRGR